MKQILLASLLFGSLTLPLAAQPAPDAPGPPDTKEERQKNTAAKLAGLLQFVSASCPEAKPNYETFKTVVRSLGLEPDALAGGELILRVKAYADVYSQDVPANCAKALENFGANGKTLPGLVVKQ